MLEQLAYLQGKPSNTARLKTESADFIVNEDLGYPLSGEGEFVVVLLRKTDCNTLFVAEQLAKFVGIPNKLVSYAGLKDRHAVTQQHFCLHLAGKETPDFSQFQVAGVEIITVTRHHRKIRTGHLKGNSFTLLLRDLAPSADLEERLNILKNYGFPNYFMEQRFGRDGHNLQQAIRWANGEITLKDRKKRSFTLSAARSEIFNQLLSSRIELGLINQVLPTDRLQLAGSNSWFIADYDESELHSLQQRLEQQDIAVTLPLVGQNAAAQLSTFEQQHIEPYTALIGLMEREKLENERRLALVVPQQFNWVFTAEGLVLSFYLPAGSYATALVRELALINQ